MTDLTQSLAVGILIGAGVVFAVQGLQAVYRWVMQRPDDFD